MARFFSSNCSFTCWKCSRNCEIKIMIEELPTHLFNEVIQSGLKTDANAGKNLLGWNKEKANNFVKQKTDAISTAREKYLETLKDR